MSTKRTRAQFTIRDDIYTRFKDFTYNKHGKLHGATSYELEHAICAYLDDQEGLPENTHTHTHVHDGKDDDTAKVVKKTDSGKKHNKTIDVISPQCSKSNGNNSKRSPTKANVDEILNYIVKKYEPTSETMLYDAHLERAIINIVGGDGRTVDRYMRQIQPYVMRSEDNECWFMDMDKLREDGLL